MSVGDCFFVHFLGFIAGMNWYSSLIPWPLTDFISQPWRKIGRRPGVIATSQTENGDSVST